MNQFITSTLKSWNQILDLNHYFLSPFVYRGQENYDWTLESSIERAVKKFSRFGTPEWGFVTEEKWMLHEFKKKYPLHASMLPKQENYFEWLAIMQHHGAPTRLLDFTHSIFIAFYFSIINSTADSSIWFINRLSLRDNLHKNHHLKYIKGEALLDEVNDYHIVFANQFIANVVKATKEVFPDTIVPLEPNIFTDRLSKQQGLFLMHTNPLVSFFDNLTAAFELKDSNFDEIDFDELIKHSSEIGIRTSIKIIKIRIPKAIHYDIMHSLKEMNITAEVLFPGLDGLARSLAQSHIWP